MNKSLFTFIIAFSLLGFSSCGSSTETQTETNTNTETKVEIKDETNTETISENEDTSETSKNEEESSTISKEDTIETSTETVSTNAENTQQEINTSAIVPEADPASFEKYTIQTFAFDTIIDIAIYSDDKTKADEVLEKAKELCYYYDDILNKSKEDSLVSQINKNKTYELNGTKEDNILLALVEKSLYYSEITNGYFDITVDPLVDLWGIGDGNDHVPADADIQAAMKKIDYHNVQVTDDAITLGADTTIDLGAIAKGFIADELKQFLLDEGINHGLLNFGGNVLTIGDKPDGSTYSIGIRAPYENTEEIIGITKVIDKSVVTSGIYERYFEENGVMYHHILDPKTGYPSEHNLLSVTIISDESVDGDAFSTSTFLLGPDEGLKLINSIDGVEAMFITKDNELIFSDNFIEKYNYTEYEQ